MLFLPGLVFGVFLARLIGEWIGLPGWVAAFILSAVTGALFAWLLARFPLSSSWPALILLAYLLYPEPDPKIAVQVAAVAVLSWVFVAVNGRKAFLSSRAITITLGLTLGAAFLALYLATLAPDVLPADSGELQTVAATLGVAHPPGFPLYTMLAHLMTRLPLGATPAYQVNLFSALTSTLTVVVVYGSVLVLLPRPVVAAIAAIALGTATTFWAQATTANIRSLTALFTGLILLSLLQFRKQRNYQRQQAADRWLVLAALFFGFGITHHVSLVFLLPLGLAFIFLADRALLRSPRRWLGPLIAGLTGLLPLLYLPWRANSGARGADPDMATLDGFLEHVLARGFSGDFFYFTDPATLWERTRILSNIWANQFAIFILMAIVVALVLVTWRDRLAALLLAGTVLIFALVAATYRAPQTVEYLMPAYVAAAVGLGYGAGIALDWLATKGQAGLAACQLLTAVLLVTALGQGFSHYRSFAFLRDQGSARHVAGPLLAEAPSNTTILSHWHWVTPLWYLQDVEGVRPDVVSRFVYPEGESYEATWARRTEDALASGAPVLTTFFDPVALAELPVPYPVEEAFLFSSEPVRGTPPDFQAMEAEFVGQGQLRLEGFSLDSDAVQLGETLPVTVAWQLDSAVEQPVSMFIRLLGSNGRFYGQEDQVLTARSEGLTLTQFRLSPRPGAPPGPATLVVGVYSNEPWLSETTQGYVPLTEITIEPGAHQPYTSNPVYRPVATAESEEQRLVGYDWDLSLADTPRLYLHWQTPRGFVTEVRDGDEVGAQGLPEYRGPWGVVRKDWSPPLPAGPAHYVPLSNGITWTGDQLPATALQPGDAITLDQWFHSDRPLLRDYVVSVRLIGLEPDGVHWAWWDLADSIPGLGAFPTLKWIAGSDVLSPHRVTVVEEAGDGQALTGALTVYDAFTTRQLPILDERITANSVWIPLGKSEVAE